MRLEKLSCAIKTEHTHISIEITVYFLLDLLILLKKLYPADIAVVNIAISTIIP